MIINTGDVINVMYADKVINTLYVTSTGEMKFTHPRTGVTFYAAGFTFEDDQGDEYKRPIDHYLKHVKDMGWTLQRAS